MQGPSTSASRRAEQETYNIGGFNEWKNIDLIRLLCGIMDEKLGRETGIQKSSSPLSRTVRDTIVVMPMPPRSKVSWGPSVTFEQGLAETVEWYSTIQKAEQCDL